MYATVTVELFPGKRLLAPHFLPKLTRLLSNPLIRRGTCLFTPLSSLSPLYILPFPSFLLFFHSNICGRLRPGG